MNAIFKELKRVADARQRDVLMRFFKTGKGEYGEGDKFLGVKVPVTRAIVKAHWAACSDADVDTLITSPYHEARLAGLLVLLRRYKAAKADEARRELLVDEYFRYMKFIDNWDLVDLTCYEILGNWYLTHDRERLREMARKGETIWVRRIAVVTTLQFIRQDDFGTTLEIAQILLDHPHDLIHKAVGWMLREVGKRNRRVLEDFLQPRYRTMPRTMLRYAIEKFPEDVRQKYLKGQI